MVADGGQLSGAVIKVRYQMSHKTVTLTCIPAHAFMELSYL